MMFMLDMWVVLPSLRGRSNSVNSIKMSAARARPCRPHGGSPLRTGIYVTGAVADALAEWELTNVVLEQEVSLEVPP